MALSMVNFITNLTVCHPPDLKDGERDGRNSATSADKSMGRAGTEKYSKHLTQSPADTFSNMTELYTQDTGCLSHSIRKWHLLLLPW